MKFPSSALFAVFVLLCGSPLLGQQSNQNHMPADAIHTGGPAAAQAATDVWLGLLDDGQYAKCWQTASSLFKRVVPQDQWTGLATSRRTPLGKLLIRKTLDATFSKTLPGAPDGQYVVVQYQSSFEHKKTAVETATAMLDQDGQWRVSGYWVR